MDYSSCGGEKTCPSCGERFGCDFERAAKCWCQVEFPPASRAVDVGGECYCPKCLKALLQGAAHSTAG